MLIILKLKPNIKVLMVKISVYEIFIIITIVISL